MVTLLNRVSLDFFLNDNVQQIAKDLLGKIIYTNINGNIGVYNAGVYNRIIIYTNQIRINANTTLFFKYNQPWRRFEENLKFFEIFYKGVRLAGSRFVGRAVWDWSALGLIDPRLPSS